MGTRERRQRSYEQDISISELFAQSGADPTKLAIAAVGSFGRGELAPGSDLDIVIVHDGGYSAERLSEIVNSILYPLWDKNKKIDHSVRTIAQTRDAMQSDLKVAMGLLDIRFIAGSSHLVSEVQELALVRWRADSEKYLPLLEESLIERHARSGELAYLLEPDLKEARGGLRDITALKAINTSGRVSLPLERISRAESLISTVRETLHTVSGRNKDKLLFTEQDKVAAALNYADADLLISDLAQAARSVDYLMQMALHRLHNRGKKSLSDRWRKSGVSYLAEGVSLENNEVVIDPNHDLKIDPAVGLRAASQAAQLGVPLSFDSLQAYSLKLANGEGALPNPWPREARENLISLIGAGSPMVEIFEALDQEDVLLQWIPEWSGVRSLPQRNVLHRHTVDRHMVETAVAAASHTRKVHRPDLLLFTALFHDIGKGTEEDHSLRGEILIKPLAARIGFSESEIVTIQSLIKHHLLLAATATRRDLDDPATIATVAENITDLGTLELLHALSIADGEATGRAAWSDWKASLVNELVRKTKAALTDNTVMEQPELSDDQIARASIGKLDLNFENRGNVYALEIISPDRTGLLSIVAGVLHLLRLDVRSARTKTISVPGAKNLNVAVMEWIVIPDPNASELTKENLFHELVRGLEAQAKLAERIEARISAYARTPAIPVPPPVVETFLSAATDATVIEVRSHDRPALLFAIGDTVRKSDIDIKSAIVTTLGAEAIDTLYVTEIGGGALTSERAIEVAARIEASLK